MSRGSSLLFHPIIKSEPRKPAAARAPGIDLLFLKNNAAIISLTNDELKKFNFQKGDTEGIVNYGLSLEGVVFCAIFIEDVNNINNVKISLRSIGTFPCNEYAGKNFSGGGHINASGGRFEGNTKNAIEKFLKTLPKYLSLIHI